MTKTATAPAPAASVPAVAGSSNVPAVAGDFDYGSDAGVGFEGTTANDLSIPFIGILQSNSPQIDGDNPVEGAKPGMLVNTVTGDLIDGEKGQAFIPVHYDRAFVEWIPRTKGGGFVTLHDPNSELVKAEVEKHKGQKGKIILSNGNELIETEYCYCLLLEQDMVTPSGFAVLSLTSTKLTPFRKFKTSLFMLKGKPPLFVNRGVLKSIKQKNDKGTFYNASFVPAVGSDWKGSLIPNNEAHKSLIEEAKSFRQMVLSGVAKAAFETQNAAGDTGSGNTEDAPF